MDTRKEAFLNKKETAFIKTVAIVMMLIHHFYGFPAWRVGGVVFTFNLILKNGTPMLELLASQFKLCVSVFAFITGYGWSQTKVTAKKTFSRIVKMLLIYEVCFAFECFVCWLLDHSFASVQDIFNQITVCFFGGTLFIGLAWYVQFYFLAVLTWPFLSKLQEIISNKLLSLLICFVPFWGTYFILGRFGLSNAWNGIIAGYLLYMPCVLMGTWIAKNDQFEGLTNDLSALWRVLLAIAFIVLILGLRIITKGRIYLDFFFAPIFVNACREIYRNTGLRNVNYFKVIADCSPWMWLVHGVFFHTPGDKILQNWLYISSNPLLVFLWGVFLVFFVSFCLKTTVEITSRLLKNSYFIGKSQSKQSNKQ